VSVPFSNWGPSLEKKGTQGGHKHAITRASKKTNRRHQVHVKQLTKKGKSEESPGKKTVGVKIKNYHRDAQNGHIKGMRGKAMD